MLSLGENVALSLRELLLGENLIVISLNRRIRQTDTNARAAED